MIKQIKCNAHTYIHTYIHTFIHIQAIHPLRTFSWRASSSLQTSFLFSCKSFRTVVCCWDSRPNSSLLFARWAIYCTHTYIHTYIHIVLRIYSTNIHTYILYIHTIQETDVTRTSFSAPETACLSRDNLFSSAVRSCCHLSISFFLAAARFVRALIWAYIVYVCMYVCMMCVIWMYVCVRTTGFYV